MRRQQFLLEDVYRRLDNNLVTRIAAFEENYLENAAYPASQMRLSGLIARDLLARVFLHYTAGEAIGSLRAQLEPVIKAFEREGEHLWAINDRNEPVFTFTFADDYCTLLQVIGLCFLLHRRDLLPRLAALQDGVDAIGRAGEGNGGTDWLYEEFMSFGVGPDKRYESEQLCISRPYEYLADAMSSEGNPEALKQLDLYLKHWYKDLAGTGWHDSHKSDENGDQGGYYGYWSYEAGAAVLLLGIEDDSSLHKYLYYPKDLVAWARAHASLSEGGESASTRLRALPGEPCPKSGFWSTPAQSDSRRHFDAGDVMPAFEDSSWGATIWYWDEQQG